MIRDHLFGKRAPADPLFRWRGGETSRLEGFSDGVFAVTLTLLIVSVDVPKTYYQLWQTIRDLPVFLACFLTLMMAWRYHYMFFRRYGLEDFLTSVLNAAFLFLILLYAYPLRFLVTFLWRLILGEGTDAMFAVPEGVEWAQSNHDQREGMMYFYGLGLVGVFGLLALMVLHAYRLRRVLDLDELECFLTRMSIATNLITVGVASLSLLVLLLGGQPGFSGVIYFLMAPLHTAAGVYGGLRGEKIKVRLAASSSS